MINDPRRRLSRARWILTAALAGGSLCSACEVRLKDAVVGGTKDYISSLLSSEEVLQNFFPFLFPSSDNGSDATTGE